MHQHYVSKTDQCHVTEMRTLHTVTVLRSLIVVRICHIPPSVRTSTCIAVPVGLHGGYRHQFLVIVASILSTARCENEMVQLILCITDRSCLTRVGIAPVIPECSLYSSLTPTLSEGEGVLTTIKVGITCIRIGCTSCIIIATQTYVQ